MQKLPVDISYTSGFERAYQILDIVIKKKAERRVEIFRQDAFSIDDKNRIAFKFINDKTVLLLDVGNHDIYK